MKEEMIIVRSPERRRRRRRRNGNERRKLQENQTSSFLELSREKRYLILPDEYQIQPQHIPHTRRSEHFNRKEHIISHASVISPHNHEIKIRGDDPSKYNIIHYRRIRRKERPRDNQDRSRGHNQDVYDHGYSMAEEEEYYLQRHHRSREKEEFRGEPRLVRIKTVSRFKTEKRNLATEKLLDYREKFDEFPLAYQHEEVRMGLPIPKDFRREYYRDEKDFDDGLILPRDSDTFSPYQDKKCLAMSHGDFEQEFHKEQRRSLAANFPNEKSRLDQEKNVFKVGPEDFKRNYYKEQEENAALLTEEAKFSPDLEKKVVVMNSQHFKRDHYKEQETPPVHLTRNELPESSTDEYGHVIDVIASASRRESRPNLLPKQDVDSNRSSNNSIYTKHVGSTANNKTSILKKSASSSSYEENEAKLNGLLGNEMPLSTDEIKENEETFQRKKRSQRISWVDRKELSKTFETNSIAEEVSTETTNSLSVTRDEDLSKLVPNDDTKTEENFLSKSQSPVDKDDLKETIDLDDKNVEDKEGADSTSLGESLDSKLRRTEGWNLDRNVPDPEDNVNESDTSRRKDNAEENKKNENDIVDENVHKVSSTYSIESNSAVLDETKTKKKSIDKKSVPIEEPPCEQKIAPSSGKANWNFLLKRLRQNDKIKNKQTWIEWMEEKRATGFKGDLQPIPVQNVDTNQENTSLTPPLRRTLMDEYDLDTPSVNIGASNNTGDEDELRFNNWDDADGKKPTKKKSSGNLFGKIRRFSSRKKKNNEDGTGEEKSDDIESDAEEYREYEKHDKSPWGRKKSCGQNETCQEFKDRILHRTVFITPTYANQEHDREKELNLDKVHHEVCSNFFVSRSVEHKPDDDATDDGETTKLGKYIKFYCEKCDDWESGSCYNSHH